jgi:hypothetical protein
VTKKDTTQEGAKKKRITLWVYTEDLDQLQALARQRNRQDWSELAREALHDGTVFAGIRGEPDRASGTYGTLNASDLAEQVYLLTGLGVTWLERHGLSITSPSDKVLAFVEALVRSGSLAGTAAAGQSHGAGVPGDGGQRALKPLTFSESDGPPENDSFVV